MATFRCLYAGTEKFFSLLTLNFFSCKGKEITDITDSIDDDNEIISDDNENENDDENEDDYEFRSNRRRYKRHVGPHDNDGLQRIISTGTKN